ncbi:chromatin assembly factor 1 subunit B [Anopheles darlingi]|uniref:chromatin assembly factor 1 subunit B n=1 Tax=Anopheles darlingi TaxID=43151 RepID=UPI0021003E59|nr:chromatin assembly factor 1 subunit B [Anopheles darlingi]
MKCQIPEISWHNRDPVLCVDIQPKGPNDRERDQHRLASGGTDSHVLIWYMVQNPECGTITLDLAADLTRHQRAVNAVRWSPSGELLASGDDESVIMIWKQKGDTEVVNIVDTTNDQDKEIWLTMKVLRGHMEDVYDLSWSPNSQFLVSGSVDNTAMVWDVMRGKSQAILHDHKGFVQGVAWDPKDKYLATLCTDRVFRVFDIQSKRVVSRSNKCTLPVPAAHPLHGKTIRLFHDDTLQTFFRRLSFSPDGNLIVTPSGVAEIEGVPKPLNTTYIYTRNSLRQPAITLPSPDQYTVAVRFCPVFFEHRAHDVEKPPIIPLPYRMVFAVATKSSVYLYDTQQPAPFALISNIHYTRLTDMAWSSDGKILIVSSTDGYCSLIHFNDGELGVAYVPPAVNTEEGTQGVASASPPQKDNKKTTSGAATASATSTTAKTASKPQRPAEKVAMPIAFRRKPKPEVETPPTTTATGSSKDVQTKEPATVVASSVATAKTPPSKTSNSSITVVKPVGGVEFIIEKDKIISSEEKFESPAKKDRPVTPIAVRRHPRTPSDVPNADEQTASSSNSSSTTKAAPQPIAIRRYPRVSLAAGGAKSPAPTTIIDPPVVEPTAEEDANDTWPIDQPKPVQRTTADVKNTSKIGRGSVAAPPPPSVIESEQTEDIILLVDSDDDDDDDEELKEKPTKASKGQEAVAEPMEVEEEVSTAAALTPKTPRRVEFRTISTPKSKKKLL